MLFRSLTVTCLGLLVSTLVCHKTEGFPALTQQQKKQDEVEKAVPALPDSVLKNLRANFEKLESSMGEDEVFRALGLCDYQKDLQAHSRYMADGAGGDWRYFIDDQKGYSLAFRSFLGAHTECYLNLPEEKTAFGFARWRTKRVAAKPVKPTYAELNKTGPGK